MITTVTHKMPGTLQEVEELLSIQSDIWHRKQAERESKVKKKRGHAWRSRTTPEAPVSGTKLVTERK